ncbi:hypothetical protein J3L18_23055 [Mucilaginibacter gossypii]|uniref:hypothetical protein n=1 Tax=Mucilaginibacter gossypii TaxID=551996 RepID=UPI000DCDA133|nr:MULTISPECIES: hypothetical protein [Mucilaginibacter]RAV56669.1 hypothetical protein DIU36_14810 [Mucilaginibacter rubeus]WMH62837.1 hypothetical protein J3L18_23055 [Mucilaginibacter gossypii]
MKKAQSISNIERQKFKCFEFEGEWYEAFDKPEMCGVWFIWGTSGSGKTTLVMELCKELCRFGRLVYNTLEEGGRKTFQNAIKRSNMISVSKRMQVIKEPLSDMSYRMKQPKSADFWVIDSYQYARMSYERFIDFREKHSDKLIIVVSQATGKNPKGSAAESVMYDADLKIYVEGFVAFSKGRYIGPNGGQKVVWKEGADLYHGQQPLNKAV